jgi:hypothetical protein
MTPTPQGGKITFSVQQVKIGYASSKLSNMLHRPSLTQVHVGQKAKLYVVATFGPIRSKLAVSLGFRVTSGGRTASFEKVTRTVPPSSRSATLGWSEYFIPRWAGSYSFSGTLFVGSAHQHKALTFQALPH